MMGYYTRHELEINPHNDGVIAELRKTCEYAKWAIDENGDAEESCKWYDHEKDLKDFSKHHPETLFTLKGEGEEAGDIWVEYHKNGLMQRVKAKIVFDDFDETLMK